jgi:hypothetical protein
MLFLYFSATAMSSPKALLMLPLLLLLMFCPRRLSLNDEGFSSFMPSSKVISTLFAPRHFYYEFLFSYNEEKKTYNHK